MIVFIFFVGFVILLVFIVCLTSNENSSKKRKRRPSDDFVVSGSSSYTPTHRSYSSSSDTASVSIRLSPRYNSSDRIGDNYSAGEIKVVGGYYRDYDAKHYMNTQLFIGHHVFLRPERNNEYDKNAVMVISSNGFHIGYLPKSIAARFKERLLSENLMGVVSKSVDRCCEFCIKVESINDTSERDQAFTEYDNRKRKLDEEYYVAEKRSEIDFYEKMNLAFRKYNKREYEAAESIIKPFFKYRIQDAQCYQMQINIYHARKDYESEERLIDEFLNLDSTLEVYRLPLKRRKYHILRQMGVIVDDTQIQTEKVGVETTSLELDAYAVVEDILRDIVDPGRIDYRDSKTLFAINLDDNRNKPICKLFLNNPNKMFIGLVENKVVKYPISSVDDIKLYSAQLKEQVIKYL